MTIASTTKKVIIGIGAVAIMIGGYFTIAQQANALTPLSSVSEGDLIRGESFSAVYYYGNDGLRYVFPTSNTYFTWYENFDTVKFISDADLATIQIGGNVTYKAGIKMIKINTDPKTYAISPSGTLRWVTSEEVAIDLYGIDWNTKIDDIPDSFFSNYQIGPPIENTLEYSPAIETALASTINDDKNLEIPAEISITDSQYSPIDVTINKGQKVRFTNNGTSSHTATADTLTWGTGTLAPGASFIASFDEEGIYTFFDSYDSSNTGAIYVE